MTSPRIMRKMTSRILRMANQNSISPYMPMKAMPMANVNRMAIIIHTAEFTSVQYWNSTHIADISAGMESQFPYTILYLVHN
jgi:hypothetical protein